MNTTTAITTEKMKQLLPQFIADYFPECNDIEVGKINIQKDAENYLSIAPTDKMTSLSGGNTFYIHEDCLKYSEKAFFGLVSLCMFDEIDDRNRNWIKSVIEYTTKPNMTLIYLLLISYLFLNGWNLLIAIIIIHQYDRLSAYSTAIKEFIGSNRFHAKAVKRKVGEHILEFYKEHKYLYGSIIWENGSSTDQLIESLNYRIEKENQ